MSKDRTQETLERTRESGKELGEESVRKNKCISKTPGKEETEKESEGSSSRRETQDRGLLLDKRRTSDHGHAGDRTRSHPRLRLVHSLAARQASAAPLADGPLEPQRLIRLLSSRPSDGEEEKPTKHASGKEAKDKDREKVPRKTLSRDAGGEYTDATGIDLHAFLVNTLQKSPRDRKLLLTLEQDVLEFLNDSAQSKEFSPMPPYQRMLAHRVAAYFGMSHHIDPTGKAVIIGKTEATRIPGQRFSELIKDEKTTEFRQRFVLQRGAAGTGQARAPPKGGRRRSMEEREEAYQRVRGRIFARETGREGRLGDTRGDREGLSCTPSSQSSADSEPQSLQPRPWIRVDPDSPVGGRQPPVTRAGSFHGTALLSWANSTWHGNAGSAGRVSGPGMALGAPEAHERGASPQPVGGLLPGTAPRQPPAPPSTPQRRPPLSNPVTAQADDLSHRFGQMSLRRPGSAEAAGPSAAPCQPPLTSPQPPQTRFVVPAKPRPLPTAHDATSSLATHIQQVLPPQGYMQPPQEIQASHYPPGQYPNSNQQHRPPSPPVAPSPQRGQPWPQPPQQPDFQPVIPHQQEAASQGTTGVWQPQDQGLLSDLGTGLGAQTQGLVLQCAPLPSYQVPVGSDWQSVVQLPFQLPMLDPESHPGPGGLPAWGWPLYYAVIPTAQQEAASPSQGFLPPGSEQYQVPQSPSPWGPTQMSQQDPGVSLFGLGIQLMQLNVPNGSESPQNLPMDQWSYCE